ncbi:DUF2062 domain-containing protein [Oleisolibacter albus]|uniref:DUF2062 domain-containing protein n=1 Tax=Oleisolibacter albus TaxID=2171757 RepID=UPI00195FD8F0|nr:DUF2062 domain-containing protein [Oleisolibacter albus]
MFQRRNRYSTSQRVREILWPRMGWGRTGRYLAYRMGRLPGSPHAIAAGLASGAAASMTPFIGLHFLLSFVVAWPVRGSYIAAAIGTVVGNPWTFPAIWYASYLLGCRVLGRVPGHGTPEQLTLSFLMEHPWQVFAPMITGGVLLGLVVWPLVYAIAKPLIRLYQQQRVQRRLKRQAASVGAAPAGSGPTEKGS